MITAGVDLAARPERTALASIEWTARQAIIRDVIYPAGDDVILGAIQQACKTGIDRPFGWPGAFVSFVTAHQIGHVGIPSPRILSHGRIIIDRESLARIAALGGTWARHVWAEANVSPSRREGEEVPRMLIAILNQSTLISDADASAMTQAVATQVRMDAAPLWDRAPAAVVFYTDPGAVPETAHGIAIVDTIQDQPQGVLGFHTEDQGGKLWGVVAAKPELDNGGQATTGDWSVSSVLSHEVLEMYVDPNCNLWANDGKGSAYSFEVCDPVEAPTYTVSGISVSNFVTPSWFDPLAPATAQFDKLGKLSTAFSILKGGYVVYESAGKEHQKFGDEFPDWRKKMKAGPLARTRRRLTQVS